MPNYTPDPTIIKKLAEEKIPFVKRCGLELVDHQEGFVHCRMPAEGNENHIGSMYAGALFTLAEIPGGVLSFLSFDIQIYYPILKSFKIDFRKKAYGNIDIKVKLDESERIRIAEQCAKEGKSDFELKSELTDSEGQVVALSHGLYQLRKNDLSK